jgi:hypothetical protein
MEEPVYMEEPVWKEAMAMGGYSGRFRNVK